MGYKNGRADDAFQPSRTEDILRMYGSEEAINSLNNTGKLPEPIVNQEDEFKGIAPTN